MRSRLNIISGSAKLVVISFHFTTTMMMTTLNHLSKQVVGRVAAATKTHASSMAVRSLCSHPDFEPQVKEQANGGDIQDHIREMIKEVRFFVSSLPVLPAFGLPILPISSQSQLRGRSFHLCGSFVCMRLWCSSWVLVHLCHGAQVWCYSDEFIGLYIPIPLP